MQEAFQALQNAHLIFGIDYPSLTPDFWLDFDLRTSLIQREEKFKVFFEVVSGLALQIIRRSARRSII